MHVRRVDSRWIRSAAVFAVVAASASPVGVASAEPAGPLAPVTPPPPLGETLTGDTLREYQAARELLSYHDDVGALVRFTRLYDQLHDARLLANMALCEKDLGHPGRAAALFERALGEGASLFPPEQLAQLRQLLDACLALSGRLRVSTGVAGAAIAIDDHVVGTSPLAADVPVDRGVHRLRVTKAGYREWTRDVTVTETAVTAVDAMLDPDTPDAVVRIVTAPGNAVALDGRPVLRGSGQVRVAAGSHALAVTAQGMVPFRADVSVREGETKTVDVTLADDRRAPLWLWVAGGTVLGIAIIVAGASVFHSSGTHAAPGSVSSPLIAW
jgi:hypothetical protein